MMLWMIVTFLLCFLPAIALYIETSITSTIAFVLSIGLIVAVIMFIN